MKDPAVCTSAAGWKFDGYPAAWAGRKDNLRVQEDYFWSVTDLLGLFFAKLGPAPEGAGPDTFFLPLTAVYARWTTILMEKKIRQLPESELKKFKPSSKAKPGQSQSSPGPPFISAREPSMFQCTWIEPVEGKGEFAVFSLGASSGGFNTQLATRAFGEHLRKARFDLLNKIQTLDKTKEVRVFQDPHDKTKTVEKVVKWGFGNPTPAMWAFGNCAETYPFLQLLV